MNREIKFRAWNPVKNQMEYDFDLSSVGDIFKVNMFETVDFYPKWELMQFTGLYSSDCQMGLPIKEAYYGDIIRFVTTEGTVLIKQLWWSDDHQCTMIGNFEYYRLHESAFIQPSKLEFEIIGNIYENPKLLNEK